MADLLMPKATAVWLIDNTTLTFDQIAAFCELHPLEVQGIADGEVAVGIRGLDPVANGQVNREEIQRCEEDSSQRLEAIGPASEVPQRTRRARYTPVSKRQDRPNAISWLLKNYEELSDAQIGKLLGTTKATINAVRERTHWNTPNITPQDPILLGICTEAELLDAVRKARARAERAAAREEKAAEAAEAAEAAAAEASAVATSAATTGVSPEQPQADATPAQPVDDAPFVRRRSRPVRFRRVRSRPAGRRRRARRRFAAGRGRLIAGHDGHAAPAASAVAAGTITNWGRTAMLIGVPKETKVHEYRVGIPPAGVRELVQHGHRVMVEKDAGTEIGLLDEHYERAGAQVVADVAEVFGAAEMIVKVKEPSPAECAMLRVDQVLFTYLHLAADAAQTAALIESGCIAIAYETVTDVRGGLPLLAPMSEVAGRMSIQAGAHCLEKEQGGRGVLLGGVPGVPPADVVILGGGVVGTHAARMAVGMGARVTIIDRSIPRLRQLEEIFGASATTVYSTVQAIEETVNNADLVIGAVLIAGAAAPKLVRRDMLDEMRRNAVVVDVAIDQGGCFETSRPTTHADPTYKVANVLHYCVTNMPGAVARTSTFALSNATLPFVLALAGRGWQQAMQDDAHLMSGLNVCRGRVTTRRWRTTSATTTSRRSARSPPDRRHIPTSIGGPR